MKQRIRAMLDEERGVSPVIGVILMVAITVILAAVIGTFVLGLGDSLQQAPQAQLDAEVDSGDNLEVSHNGGDAISVSDLRITIDGATNTPFNSDSIDQVNDDDGEFNVGDTIEVTDTAGATEDTQIRVIHVPSESIILDTEVTFADGS